MKKMSAEQIIQEKQYEYPYHYIPGFEQGHFSQVQSWSWGMQYLGGIELVISKLNEIDFDSLLDVGCGDGRLLREAAKRFPSVDALGVDFSRTAIELAKAMNPGGDYVCTDITKETFPRKYDVATMVEVLEHIPPEDIPLFLEAVKSNLNPTGKLFLTVPHENKKVTDKHYQHFSKRTLADALSGSFEVETIIPFDRQSRLNGRLLTLLGYSGSNYLITNRKINGWLYSRIIRGCLNEQPEEKCGRLLAIANPK